MFEIVKTARLQPHELAKMLSVSRVTVSMWVNGHNKPHHLLEARVGKLLDAVKSAVESGDLPVPFDVTRRERPHYVNKTLVKHLKARLAAQSASEQADDE